MSASNHRLIAEQDVFSKSPAVYDPCASTGQVQTLSEYQYAKS